MLELTLVRHAKSSWKHPELADFDRPLKKRGFSDAALIGKWMQSHSLQPDRIISSSALRAVSTARVIVETLKLPPKSIHETQKLYFSGCERHLQVVHDCKDKIKSIMMVGHNPIISSFAEKLCGAKLGEVPTAALVHIDFDLEHWSEIQYGAGRLQHYIVPKSLR
ncbi:MAG: SixA phosphatase family protein [Thiotrichales bacterium]